MNVERMIFIPNMKYWAENNNRTKMKELHLLCWVSIPRIVFSIIIFCIKSMNITRFQLWDRLLFVNTSSIQPLSKLFWLSSSRSIMRGLSSFGIKMNSTARRLNSVWCGRNSHCHVAITSTSSEYWYNKREECNKHCDNLAKNIAFLGNSLHSGTARGPKCLAVWSLLGQYN